MSFVIQLILFVAFTAFLYNNRPDVFFGIHILFAFCGVYWTFYLFIEAPWKIRRALTRMLRAIGFLK
jgi:hypothetical protein